ncbi:type 1 glutamine amidotransferase [Planctomycetota bacterium]|nr:type 1 glutamine amidotransferase [Planctomycetota bacterium]
MPVLKNLKIAMFVGDEYEDLELQYPKYRMREVAAEVVIAGIEEGVKYVGKYGYPQVSDAAVKNLSAVDFDGLIVPGGWMPDKLRRYEEVLKFVRDFEKQEKMIASICHGAWINISADVVKGYRYTSTPGIKDDMTNAGAEWEDAEVVVDRHHISSRRPDDLPQFCRAIIDYLVKQKKTVI